MNWAKRVLVRALLLGIVPLSLGQGASAAPAVGDVVVEIEPVTNGRSPSTLQTAKAPSPSSQSNFPTFNSQQLDRQLRLYREYVEEYGTPDVLIVGSSRALQGVDPVVLQKSLAQQGYPTLKVFNFGINGATAQVVNWVLQRLFSTDKLPKLIVWADGARAFNSGRLDHTFNKIIQSDGHKLLMAGVKPFPLSNGLKVGQICMDFLPTALQARRSNAPMYYPTQMPVRGNSTPRSPQETCTQSIRITVKDSNPLLHNTDSPKKLAESLGFQIVNSRFSPGAYFQRYPKVPGAYDADYRNFALDGTQAVAFDSLMKFANARKIPLVFVNLPLTNTYLDPARSFYEDQFQGRMQRLSRSKLFIFKDLVSLSKFRSNHYFADPSHLNQYGAAAVSQQISRELVDLLPKVITSRETQSFLAPSLCKNACFLLPRMFIG